MASSFSYVDLSDMHRKRAAAQNVSTMFNLADPATRENGMHWYERVNEAVAKGVRGTSTSERSGAGLVAAVSPNMDWEKRNIDALKELHGLNRHDWDQILRQHDRSPLKGTSIEMAPDKNLEKAHRIMEGEDPDEVLNRNSGPKVNSFFHNIAEPDVAGHVTIDGRAHDIAANRLQGWGSNRGIGSAALKTGKQTRYEHFEDAYRIAAHSLSDQTGQRVLPHQAQAVTWETAKGLERSGTTKKGTPRKHGPARKGQPYLGPGGLHPTPGAPS